MFLMQKTLKENGNTIYGDLSKQKNFKVEFMGSNNLLYFAGTSQNVQINFRGDNSLVFIGNKARVNGKIEIATNGVCYIGDDSTFNGVAFRIFEGKNIIVGNDCMFSWSIWLSTCDHHLIFDFSYQRTNFSKSIYIGDHIWCGQESAILKGTFIPSGSIIGAKSIIRGIKDSNTIYAGNPAQCIKAHKFWLREDPAAGNWTQEQTNLYAHKETSDFQYIYQQDRFLSPTALEAELESLKSASEKLKFLYDSIYCNTDKNRFAYFKNCPYNLPLPRILPRFQLLTHSQAHSDIASATKDRIHNHLAYKLGQALILNSKSLWGYIRMPYVLSYIKESHKKEILEYEAKIKKNPSLKLPKLESYPDYKEALKEKECFTYKLGVALMQADKDWYKGGYLRFYFQEVPRLKREFREKKK